MSGFPRGGGVTKITSTDFTIANPTGPTADIDGPLLANLAAGGFKITGLANGTAATDAAAFGQIPTIPTNTYVSARLTANVNLPPGGSPTTLLTTASLGAGTWLMIGGALLEPGSGAADEIDLTFAGGTATVTFGPLSFGVIGCSGIANSPVSVVTFAIATITGPGTLIFEATNQDASVAGTALHLTEPSAQLQGVTGYVGIQLK